MRSSLPSSIVLASLVLTAAPAFGTGRPGSVAILETQALGGASQALADLVNERIAEYATNDLKLEVVSKKDIASKISFDQQKQLLGCDSATCESATNVGEALNVEKIVTSSLTKIGEKISVSLVALDVATTKVIGRQSREVPNEAELTETAKDLVHFVLKGEARESKGTLRLLVSEAGARIIIDGQFYGTSPLQAAPRLLAGRHKWQVEKEGFIPQEGSAEIEVAKETLIEAKLLSTSKVEVAGAGLLPWAGAVGALALAATGVMVGGLMYSQQVCAQYQLDLDSPADQWRCYKGEAVKPISLVETQDEAGNPVFSLARAKDEVANWGWEAVVTKADGTEEVRRGAAFYAGVGSIALGVVSVGLFSAYFVMGRSAGGGSDVAAVDGEEPRRAHWTDDVQVLPTPNGIAVRF